MVLFALLASLPMLRREETPGIGMEELLSSAEAYLSAKKAGLFKALSLSAEETSAFPAKSLAAKYVKWEGSLRNAIARQRAARLGLDPAAYLRDFSYDTEADRFVRDAFAAENPLEREKLLDASRWMKLEELEFGHRFDFDVLCAYKLKLEILLKWKARSAEHAAENLDLAAAEVRKEKKAV